jgi:hypothetical protein
MGADLRKFRPNQREAWTKQSNASIRQQCLVALSWVEMEIMIKQDIAVVCTVREIVDHENPANAGTQARFPL